MNYHQAIGCCGSKPYRGLYPILAQRGIGASDALSRAEKLEAYTKAAILGAALVGGAAALSADKRRRNRHGAVGAAAGAAIGAAYLAWWLRPLEGK